MFKEIQISLVEATMSCIRTNTGLSYIFLVHFEQ